MVIGHIAWLIGISLVSGSASTDALVLVLAALVFLGAGGIGYQAWQRYQRNELVPAAFLGGLPVLPVIFTLFVLGATYL